MLIGEGLDRRRGDVESAELIFQSSEVGLRPSQVAGVDLGHRPIEHLAALGEEVGHGHARPLRFRDQGGEDGGVDLRHSQPRRKADDGQLHGVETGVEHPQDGLAPCRHVAQWIGGKHNDGVDLPVLQSAQSLPLVVHDVIELDQGPEPLRRQSDLLGEGGARVAHEHRAERSHLVAVADAEGQEDQERAEDQRDQQPRLAQDVEGLLPEEGGRCQRQRRRAPGDRGHRTAVLSRWARTRRMNTSS